MKTRLKIFTTVLSVLACCAFLPKMQAGTLPPETDGPPDGCYINFATAEGCMALDGNQPFTGLGSTAIGWRSLFFSGSSFWNTGVGAGTLAINTGDENTATGAGALLINLDADHNTANGAFALFQNQLGFNNTAVGAEALFFNDVTTAGSANNNTAVGWRAMQENVNAARNTAVGSFALQENDFFGADVATDNTAVGFGALRANVDGNPNTAVGSGALGTNVGAGGNTAVGAAALALNNSDAAGFPFGDFNTAVGALALAFNIDGFSNAAVGTDALTNNTSGFGNTAMGDTALFFNNDVSANTAIGDAALQNNGFTLGVFTANANVAVGSAALFGNDSGSDNDAVGAGTMSGNVIGLQNVAMGSSALGAPSLGAQIGNVTLGFNAQASDDGNFTTAVGWNAGTDPGGALTDHIQDIYLGVEAGQVDLNGNPVPTAESFTTRIGSFFTEPGGVKSCFIGGIRSFFQPIPAHGGLASVRVVTIDLNDGGLGFDLLVSDQGGGSPSAPNTLHAPPILGIPQPRSAPQAPVRPSAQHQAMNDKVENLEATVAQLKSTVAKQEATIAQQQRGMDAMTVRLNEQASQIQKVSAQLEVSKPAPQVVTNKP